MKTKILFLVLLAFVLNAKAQTPNWCWGKGSIGTGHDEGRQVATDENSNIYITGSFNSSTISFGSDTLKSPYGGDVFLVKYDIMGNVIWTRSSTKSNGHAEGYGVATDNSGNIYITGNFDDTICFGSFTLNNSGVFLVKYDATGNVLWAKKAGGINDGAQDVATDLSGNVYITGAFYNSSIIFGTDTLVNAGGTGGSQYDIFLAKFNASGNAIWAKRAGKPGFDVGYAVATDTSGNIYITGYLGITDSSLISYVTFGTDTVYGPGYFLVKYSGTGNVIWAKYHANSDYGEKIAIDASENIYLRTTSSLIKCSSSGSVVWLKAMPGTGRSVTIDTFGNIYTTATMGGLAIVGTDTLTSGGVDPLYIAKLNPSGNVICAAALPSGGDDWDGVATDISGNAYIGGDYQTTVPIIIGDDTLPITALYGESIFIAKYTCGVCIEPDFINEQIHKENISIYPNPATDNLTIDVSATLNIPATIEITNIEGQVLKQQTTNVATTNLVVSALAKGMYFVKVRTEKGVAVKKFVKE